MLRPILRGARRSAALALAKRQRPGPDHAGNAGRRVLVVPPSSPGSLGDEAMMIAAAAQLREHGITHIDILDFFGETPWQPISGFDNAVRTSLPTTRWWLALPKLIARYTDLLIVGADCMDGNYSVSRTTMLQDIAGVAANAGLHTSVLGCSFRQSAPQAVIDGFRAMPEGVRVCIRDPISHRRFENTTRRDASLTADVAFLLQPQSEHAPHAEELRRWADRQRDAGRIVLGVNLNKQVIKGDHDREDRERRLADSYADALRDALERRPDLAVLCVPHDYREPFRDDLASQHLAERLREHATNPGRIMSATQELDAPAAKAVAACTDAGLTGRMHYAIASLGSGKPVASVTYQGKFEGLYQHFGLDPLYLDPEQASDHTALSALVDRLLDEREQLTDTVRERLDRVRGLAELNLAPHVV